MSDAEPQSVGVEALSGPAGPVPLIEVQQIQLVARGAKPHRCVGCDVEIVRDEPSMVVTATGPYRPWRLCEDCAPASVDGVAVLWGRGATWRAPGIAGGGHTLAGWHPLPISREEAACIEEQRAEQRRIAQTESEEHWRQHDAERVAEAAAREAAEQAAWEKAMAVLTEMCDLAGKYVAGDNQQWATFEHIAEGLAKQAAALLCSTAAGDEWYGPPPATLSAAEVAFLAEHVCKRAALATARRLLSDDPVAADEPHPPAGPTANGA